MFSLHSFFVFFQFLCLKNQVICPIVCSRFSLGYNLSCFSISINSLLDERLNYIQIQWRKGFCFVFLSFENRGLQNYSIVVFYSPVRKHISPDCLFYVCDITSYWCSMPRSIDSLGLQMEPFLNWTMFQTYICIHTSIQRHFWEQMYLKPTLVFPLTISLFHSYLFLTLSCYKNLFSVQKQDMYNTK